MKTHDPIPRIISCAVLLWLFTPAGNSLPAADTRQIPDPLKTWEDWATWTLVRSGPMRPKKRGLGTRHFPVIDSAPGRYVHG